MSQEDFLALARRAGALLEGHFLLSSGLHSPAYFQCARLLERPEVASELGRELAERLPHELRAAIELTIAPALGGILVAHEVGRALGVRALFAERDPATSRLALRRGFSIDPGEKALVLEDVVTTGGSLRETVGVVERSGGHVVAAGALVHRGGEALFPSSDGPPFYTIARLDFPAYSPDVCPLCRQGSVPIKPGSRPSTRGT